MPRRAAARSTKKNPCGCAVNPRRNPEGDELLIEPARVTPGEPADLGSCLQWVKLEKVPSEYEACMDRLGQLGKIQTAKDTYEALRGWYAKQDQEVGVVLLIDVQLNVRGAAEVSRGERDSTIVPIPDILRVALVDGATGIIFCHNHPTGSSSPSDDDKTSTVALDEACEAVGLMLMGHVVFGRDEYYSFADSGLLTSEPVMPADPEPTPWVEPEREEPLVDPRAREARVEARSPGAARGWAHRREKDEWVVQNLDPALVPLWTRTGSSFRGAPEERYEAFIEYVHDHPGEETEALQAGADSGLDAEVAAGRARENPRLTPDVMPYEGVGIQAPEEYKATLAFLRAVGK